MVLRLWAAQTNPRKRIKKLNENIHDVSLESQTPECVEEINRLEKELEQLYLCEGLYWRQRSKTVWMKEGDRNTQFFTQKPPAA